MIFQNQGICRRCNVEMQTVATIDPMGGGPGLIAFVCTNCGASNSVLVYPTKKTRQVNYGRPAEGRGISDRA